MEIIEQSSEHIHSDVVELLARVGTHIELANDSTNRAGRDYHLEEALTILGRPEKLGASDITHLRQAWRVGAGTRLLYKAISDELAGITTQEADNETLLPEV